MIAVHRVREEANDAGLRKVASEKRVVVREVAAIVRETAAASK